MKRLQVVVRGRWWLGLALWAALPSLTWAQDFAPYAGLRPYDNFSGAFIDCYACGEMSPPPPSCGCKARVVGEHMGLSLPVSQYPSLTAIKIEYCDLHRWAFAHAEALLGSARPTEDA